MFSRPTAFKYIEAQKFYFFRFISSILFLYKKRRVYSLLKIDLFRFLICKARKFYYIKVRKKLKIWDGSEERFIIIASTNDSTIQHNLKGLHDVSSARSLRIIKPLSVIESYRTLNTMPILGGELHDLDYPCEAKVLSIGPRTEGEVFCLMAYGFKPKNIIGIDLISYSPFIDVGDMHCMKYADNAFDIVICSCVLVYSKDPLLACSEILRVCRNGGLICLSQDTTPNAGKGHLESNLKQQTITIDHYLKLFSPFVKRVFWQHELPERLQDDCNIGSNYTMSVIFQIEKN